MSPTSSRGRTTRFTVDHLRAVARPTSPPPAAWLTRQFARADGPHAVASPCSATVQLHWQAIDGLVFIQARVKDAIRFDAQQLEAAAFDAYTRMAQWLDALDRDRSPHHPWRFWNFVPDIVGRLDGGLHRYMAFNAGRHRAFEAWHGETFQPRLVAASAVDHLGPDLHVQMLAGPQPAIAIENPRQLSAYRYSPRFGPLPPSFARATLARTSAHDWPQLYVAGTASIVGEDSLHTGDTIAQTHETVRNLNALLGEVSQHDPLLTASYRQLRVYLVEPADEAAVLAILDEAMPAVEDVEVMPARLCRPELLVEIDAMAQCQPIDADPASAPLSPSREGSPT